MGNAIPNTIRCVDLLRQSAFAQVWQQAVHEQLVDEHTEIRTCLAVGGTEPSVPKLQVRASKRDWCKHTQLTPQILLHRPERHKEGKASVLPNLGLHQIYISLGYVSRVQGGDK